MRAATFPVLLWLTACATVPPDPSPLSARAAIGFDLHGEKAALAEGLADPASGRAVTIDDPVRIASVSKLVVAIGVMRLVEQGKLDLDRDISAYLGWTFRNPAFPDRPITLRQLLSHTSSLRDGDDAYVIPLGHSLKEALADPAVWDPAHGPGEGYFAYTNFNFPVVGSVMEMATGERFDLLMSRLVLAPMKLDACYNWPGCSDAAVARAVVLMQDGKAVRDDLGGKRPACPVFVREGEPCDLDRWRLGDNGALFSPQGGLRISARGLARVGRMLLGGGTIDGVRILIAAVGRSDAGAGLAIRWRQRLARRRKRGRLQLWLRYAPACDTLGKLRRRSGRQGPALGWPCRRRLWPPLRRLDRPQARRRHRLLRHRPPRRPAAR